MDIVSITQNANDDIRHRRQEKKNVKLSAPNTFKKVFTISAFIVALCLLNNNVLFALAPLNQTVARAECANKKSNSNTI